VKTEMQMALSTRPIALATVPLALFAIVLAVAVILPGCTTMRSDQRLAEQAALSVELAYQAAAIGTLAALQTDRYDVQQRRCIGKLDDRAYTAVRVARSAYDRRDSAVADDVVLARKAVTMLLDREGC
jgi:pectin methylesterase-like acyl-CoA thioesterase